MKDKLKTFFNLKELAASLSLANLFFLRTWQELIFAEPADRFYLKTVTGESLVAVILNVLLLGLIFRAILYFYRNRSKETSGKWGALILLLALLVPLNALRQLVPGLSFGELSGQIGTAGLAVLLTLFFGLLIYIASKRPAGFSRVVSTALLILFPFFFLTFFQAIWGIVTVSGSSPVQQEGPEAAAAYHETRSSTDSRVLWLVFDELDQRMTFEERPPDVETPVLDDILEKAIFADKAYAPGEETVVSMPAFITGRRVAKAEPAAPDELLLFYEDKGDKAQPKNWSEQENVFSRAQELGYDTGLVGCFLPYCRVIGHTLSSCYWQPFGTVELKKDFSIPQVMLTQLMSSFSISPFNQRTHAINLYHLLLKKAEKAAADQQLGLVMVHWSIPHYPWIYDRHAEEFTLFNYDMNKGYFDNLALADYTLGKLRREMKEEGAWENTHLIITSDHPWRMELFPIFDRQFDPRIPFIVRLAGQKQPHHHREPFDTTKTHDLVLHLLEGNLENPEEVIQWMEQQKLQQ